MSNYRIYTGYYIGWKNGCLCTITEVDGSMKKVKYITGIDGVVMRDVLIADAKELKCRDNSVDIIAKIENTAALLRQIEKDTGIKVLQTNNNRKYYRTVLLCEALAAYHIECTMCDTDIKVYPHIAEFLLE